MATNITGSILGVATQDSQSTYATHAAQQMPLPDPEPHEVHPVVTIILNKMKESPEEFFDPEEEDTRGYSLTRDVDREYNKWQRAWSMAKQAGTRYETKLLEEGMMALRHDLRMARVMKVIFSDEQEETLKYKTTGRYTAVNSKPSQIIASQAQAAQIQNYISAAQAAQQNALNNSLYAQP